MREQNEVEMEILKERLRLDQKHFIFALLCDRHDNELEIKIENTIKEIKMLEYIMKRTEDLDI